MLLKNLAVIFIAAFFYLLPGKSVFAEEVIRFEPKCKNDKNFIIFRKELKQGFIMEEGGKFIASPDILSKTDIKELQKIIAKNEIYTGKIDGVIGSITSKALKEFLDYVCNGIPYIPFFHENSELIFDAARDVGDKAGGEGKTLEIPKNEIPIIFQVGIWEPNVIARVSIQWGMLDDSGNAFTFAKVFGYKGGFIFGTLPATNIGKEIFGTILIDYTNLNAPDYRHDFKYKIENVSGVSDIFDLSSKKSTCN